MAIYVQFLFVVPAFSVTVSSSNSLQEIMVGDFQEIHCSTEVSFNGVELNSVLIEWYGPKEDSITNDSRVTISSTMASTNIFASILQFSYLMEEDEGRYICNVTILRTTESDSIELTRLDG